MNFSVDRPTAGATPDMSTMAFHINGKQMTMAGFAEMLGQFASQIGGGAGRQIVDMTGLKGHYEVSLAIPFADLMAMAKAQGMDVPNMPGAGGVGDGSERCRLHVHFRAGFGPPSGIAQGDGRPGSGRQSRKGTHRELSREIDWAARALTRESCFALSTYARSPIPRQ